MASMFELIGYLGCSRRSQIGHVAGALSERDRLIHNRGTQPRVGFYKNDPELISHLHNPHIKPIAITSSIKLILQSRHNGCPLRNEVGQDLYLHVRYQQTS